ncbi:hypothetical protein N7491_004463 [Penicillium cf. griseofulvum]|uniref:Uncharacterized protein n=1 Tax=Penicillium cf. griseofulvum TaxID=2972120 RepID=A0A9W9M400_9EURO|nr:hypothetical protein N7472_007152 [Penicillium cf. griseofulvum]KAJ5433868.1 hypothetical protein N7491_004463 [Penicillium cf. griseofulvum]
MAIKSATGSRGPDITMKTMLQTHLRQVFNSEIKIEPPTFWEGLSPEERRESVDQQQSWGFKGQFAWNPAGRVMEEWNASIYQNLLKPLFRESTAKLFRGVRKQCLYDIACWMVGNEWQSSHPAAIILSGDPKVSRNGVKLVKRHGQLLFEFGFRVYEYESDVLPSMTTSLIDELNITTSLCGMRFVVGGSDGMSSRRSTLGGAVIIGEEYFGVTVLHPFIERHQNNEPDDDDQSDFSDSDDNPSSMDIDFHSEGIVLDADTIYFPESESQGRFVGAIPQLSRSRYFSPHMDWALVKLESTTGLLLNFAKLDDKVVVPSKVSVTFPKNPVWAIVNSATPVQTRVSPVMHGLFLPHSGLQDAWALNMKPTLGDSGAWVVDPETESIFGIIVAGSALTETSFILPAQNVFSEIWERFPGMQFPLSGDLHTLLKAVNLEMPQIAELAVTKSTSTELNLVGYEDWSPLSLASSKGSSALVASLLQAGADPNLACSPSTLPLYLAAYGGFLEVIRILLEFGVDPNSRGAFYMKPSYKLQKGADDKDDGDFSNALQAASLEGHKEVAQMLLDRGANINASGGRYGNALQAASSRGHKEVVQILLDRGANVNASGGRHGNALQAASSGGHKEVVQILLERGSNITYHQLVNALEAASSRGHKEVVQVLLDCGANVNTQDGQYSNALEAASSGGHKEVVQMLLDYGADVNARRRFGKNALEAASLGGHKEVVQMLLDCGANVNAQDGHYGNALEVASSRGHKEVVQMLLDRGANINASGGRHGNALQAASSRGHKEVVQILLDRGANVNVQGGKYRHELQASPVKGHQ